MMKIHPGKTAKKTFTAIAFFICIMGALFSMLEIRLLSFTIIPPVESFKILLNHLFTISEQHQAYEYMRFAVSVPPESYGHYIFTAITLVAVTAAIYTFIMQKYESKAMCICIFLLFTGAQVYFGVFASPVWNIALYAAIAWVLLPKAKFAAFAGIVVIMVLAAILFSPGSSPLLAELSENIRDQFGEQAERPVAAQAPLQELSAEQQMQDLQMHHDTTGQTDQPSGNAFGIDRSERFSGSQIGTAVGQRLWVLWLIGLAFTVGFAVWFLAKFIAAYKRRQIFDSADSNLAIHSMFIHLIHWLVEFGIVPQNFAYSQYVNQVETMFCSEYAKNYLSVVGLWQKAIYSNHTMAESDKKQMRAFLNETKHILTKRVNPFARAIVRMRLFLHI